MRQHRTLLVACVATFLAGSAVTAWAGHATTSVPSYTGCLNLDSGTLSHFKKGNSPLEPCTRSEVQMHLSGGDITSVLPATGGGLTGGASQGSVELGLDAPTVDGRYVNEGQADSITSAMLTDDTIVGTDLDSDLRLQIKCGAHPRLQADFSGCLLDYVDFSNAMLMLAQFQNANLHGANLNGANLNLANLSGANLSATRLQAADLTDADVSSARLNGADLRGADLTRADLRDSDLALVKLNGADLRDADLRGANLSSANLTSASLFEANLSGAVLNGVTWNNTICPDGTNSNTNFTNPRSCLGHL